MAFSLKIFLSILLVLASPVFSVSTLASSVEDSEPSSRSSLRTTLETLEAKIARSHSKRDFLKLLELSKTFNKLSYKKDQWESQAQHLQVEKWPNQNWKQSVGGHLFYPPNIDHFLSCDSTRHLITRRDILWAFAIAATYKHPFAQYYLAQGLDQSHRSHYSSSRPSLITELYRMSLDVMEKCLHHPQACYLLALNHTCHASQVGIYPFDLEKALEFHAQGSSHDSTAGKQNRVARLNKCSVYGYGEAPRCKEYKKIEQYGPAYVKAAHLTERSKKKAQLLEKAVSSNFPQAYLALGRLHDQKKREEDALKAYEEAGNQGVPRGYILLSHRLLGGDPSLRQSSQDLTKVSPESLRKAKGYLSQAGKAGDYEGWDQLVSLQEKLYELYENEEDLHELIDALEKGLEMGSGHAHHKAKQMFPTRYNQLVAQYGDPSHQDLQDYFCQALGFKTEGNV